MQKNLKVEVTEELLLKKIGGRKNKGTSEYLQNAISLGSTLLDPKGIYDLFPVAQIEKDRLILENGELFRSEHPVSYTHLLLKGITAKRRIHLTVR